MRQFNVGDRVRYDNSDRRSVNGQTGVIVRKEPFYGDSFGYWVAMDDETEDYEAGCENWALSFDIKHLEVANDTPVLCEGLDTD